MNYLPWLTEIFDLLDRCFNYRGGGYGTKSGGIAAKWGPRAGEGAPANREEFLAREKGKEAEGKSAAGEKFERDAQFTDTGRVLNDREIILSMADASVKDLDDARLSYARRSRDLDKKAESLPSGSPELSSVRDSLFKMRSLYGLTSRAVILQNSRGKRTDEELAALDRIEI